MATAWRGVEDLLVKFDKHKELHYERSKYLHLDQFRSLRDINTFRSRGRNYEDVRKNDR